MTISAIRMACVVRVQYSTVSSPRTRRATTPVRRRNLHGIRRGRQGRERDTQPKYKTTHGKCRQGLAGDHNDHSEDDDPASAEHGPSTTVLVAYDGADRRADYVSADVQNGFQRCDGDNDNDGTRIDRFVPERHLHGV
jgi:hypothetical protein